MKNKIRPVTRRLRYSYKKKRLAVLECFNNLLILEARVSYYIITALIYGNFTRKQQQVVDKLPYVRVMQLKPY